MFLFDDSTIGKQTSVMELPIRILYEPMLDAVMVDSVFCNMTA